MAPRRTTSEQKDMLRREERCKGPWSFNYDIGSLESGREVAKQKEQDLLPKALSGDVDICWLLEKFPREIRDKIWALLFERVQGIVPGIVRYKLGITYRGTKVNIYSYQWENNLQRQYETHGLPHYDGSPQNIQIAWPSHPTESQRRLIENEEWETVTFNEELSLPSTFDEGLNADVRAYILKHGEFATQIINRAIIQTTRLQGINILRANKQICAEASAVLYGKNTFIFDTSGHHPFTHHRGVHEHDAFNQAAHRIPGLIRADGSRPSRAQNERSVARIFDETVFQPKFIHRDTLTRFFSQIGRKNASLITKIKIEGIFKTAEDHWRYRDKRPIGFARLLPIYTIILGTVCQDMKELTLHRGDDNELWDDDLEKTARITDEQRVDRVIGSVVGGLPSLKKLQLGNYHFIPREEIENAWGSARRWMGIVANRERDHKRLEAERKERDKKREEARELDQYIWKQVKAVRGGNLGRNDGENGGEKVTGGAVSKVARPNPFDVLVDNALSAAAADGGGRQSFRKGKKKGIRG